MQTSSTSNSDRLVKRTLLACGGLIVVCGLLYVVAGWLGATLAEGIGQRLIALGRGRIINPEEFLTNRLSESAVLGAIGAGLLIAVVQICRSMVWRLPGATRWVSAAVIAFAAVNVWVWAATGTVLFWATLYFGGPNLMQSAYHFERLQLKQSSAPVRAIVLGSSQGGSQIQSGYLNEWFGPDVRVANLAYAGTEASEFMLEAELFEDLHPDVVVIYVNESNFYQGVSGSRYLPFMTPAGMSHVLDSGALDLGARERFSYAVVGLALPLFHIRRAVEFFTFGYRAANKEYPRGPSPAAAGGLDERADGLSATYSMDDRSEFQKREFLGFLEQQVARGVTPLILVGQVNPILEAKLDSAMRRDFASYVDELARLYPDSVVRSEDLPRHAPEDYFPSDLMHINHEARLMFAERLVSLLEERLGWVRRTN